MIVLLGLTVAFLWGSADTVATFAVKRVGTAATTVVAQVAGLFLVALLGLAFAGPLGWLSISTSVLGSSLLYGIVLGGVAAGAYLTLYRALGHGPLAVASPVVSAQGGVTLLLAVAVLQERLIGVAARETNWFIGIVFIRCFSFLFLAVTLRPDAPRVGRERPGARWGYLLSALVGCADLGGLTILSYAMVTGSIGVAGMISSAYGVIPLAAGMLLLKERVTASQILGVLLLVTGLVGEGAPSPELVLPLAVLSVLLVAGCALAALREVVTAKPGRGSAWLQGEPDSPALAFAPVDRGSFAAVAQEMPAHSPSPPLGTGLTVPQRHERQWQVFKSMVNSLIPGFLEEAQHARSGMGSGPLPPGDLTLLLEKGEEWATLNLLLHHSSFPQSEYVRVVHILREFIEGHRLLAPTPPSVVFRGGYGTLDELFEALLLVQTGKVPRFPIVLYGSQFWAGLVN